MHIDETDPAGKAAASNVAGPDGRIELREAAGNA